MAPKILWILISFVSFFMVLPAASGEQKMPGDMVLVQGGAFLVGNKEIPSDEESVHDVSLKNFYMGKYEVTQEEWRAVMGNNPSLYKGDKLPMDNITWHDAVAYCNKKSLAEGLTPCYSERRGENESAKDITCNFAADGYRLPTEAEWEYACRGGGRSLHYNYSGSHEPGEVSWYELNSNYKTHPVGQKKPNELGIFDMGGNVSEWCWDLYDKDSQKRVYRGGNVDDPVEQLRCTARFSAVPAYKYCDLGFRVVKNDQGNPGGLKNMVWVQGGVFKMGNSSGKNNEKNEKRVHPVTVSDFYIARCEVTQEEWRAVMGDNPSFRKGSLCPVNFVDWYSAVQYCNKRSEKEGLTPCYSGSGAPIICDFGADGYRLPTEVEWEYACRGGRLSQNYKFSGSNDAGEVAWYNGNITIYFEPVGKKKPNELGIYDMSGNAWEWCWDRYDIDYYEKSPGKDPRGPLTGIRRVIRGGSWRSSPDTLWCSARSNYEPHQKSSFIGFRVVRTAETQMKENKK